MTREEFYEKYGSVVVRFKSYYKYTFTFEGKLTDGSILTCGYGGSGEIYRYEVSVDKEETVASLSPYTGSVYNDGVEVESFYDES